MCSRPHPRSALAIGTAASVLAWLVSASPAPAATGGKPPTPTNFRVAAKAPFSVTLAWDAPKSTSGDFTYRLSSTASGSARVTLPRTATNYTWSDGIHPGGSYWFFLYAVDAAGKASGQVNVSATVPRDTIAPSKPVVAVASVGPTHVTLAPHATDDGPYVFY